MIPDSVRKYVYYEEPGIVLLKGDCLEILPLLEANSIDLVLTDPPYGIKRDGQRASDGKHGGRKSYEFLGWDDTRPVQEVFDNILRVGNNCIIWGGNYFADMLPATSKWIVWDKGQRINQSDGELAYTSYGGALRIMTFNRVEIMKDGAMHPTQKPVKLMKWCVGWTDPQTVLDPFLGSGTTAVAAKQLGRKCIGIEIESKYLDIAIERLRQGILL